MIDLDLLLLERRVEALLAPWQGGPGVSIGAVRDGQLVVHRSAGLASLEFGVPIGPETRFRIASVSKQFTCAAVLMLAEEGKLRLDAAARDYLPELPDFGETITLLHLMHNTSGLRDMLEIMRFGGADLGTPVRAEDLLAGICRQRRLNFSPGSRFRYSNTNFLLLGLVAERVSGQELGALLQQRIFDPLGMADTRLTPHVGEPVPRLATGYLPAEDGGWKRAPHAFPLGGEGGLVSSVADLALWSRNFSTRRVGAAWLDELAREAAFPDGSANRYARGLVVRPHRGGVSWSHGGLWPGYRTEFLMLPQAGLAVIVIANAGSADPNLIAHQVLDAMLPGPPPPALPARDSLDRLGGTYVDPAGATTLDLSLSPSGVPTFTSNGVGTPAEPTLDGRLAAARANTHFTVRAIDDGTIEVEEDAGVRGRWHRAPADASLPHGLAGTYRSEEMAATWTVGERVTVAGPVAAGVSWAMQPVEGDLFRIIIPGALYRGWLDVRARRDGERIVALEANGGRARQVRFERLDG